MNLNFPIPIPPPVMSPATSFVHHHLAQKSYPVPLNQGGGGPINNGANNGTNNGGGMGSANGGGGGGNHSSGDKRRSSSTSSSSASAADIPPFIEILPGEKPLYHCTICNKKFKTKAHTKYHEFCQEGSVKPFKCTFCGRSFVTKGHFEYHLRTHTGDRHRK